MEQASIEPTAEHTAPLSLSLIIPAYNEAHRIVDTLATAAAYLDAQPYPSELILVDDGSTDGTFDLATHSLANRADARALSITHAGKAAAIRAGMRAAGCDLVAFSDADLATPLSYLDDLRMAITTFGCDVAIGSREGIGARRLGEPLYRHVMGRVFNLLVRTLVLPGIQDTQCGFKLFTRDAAHALLDRALLYTADDATVTGPRVTAFDVELLVIARRLGLKTCPIPVVWTYGTHTKVNPLRDTWQNVRDVLLVRWHDWRGRYR